MSSRSWRFQTIFSVCVLHKCISKFLYKISREVLPYLVDSNQCAFVPGSEMMHNNNDVPCDFHGILQEEWIKKMHCESAVKES